MLTSRPVFVDCLPEIAPFLTADIRSILPEMDMHWDAPEGEAGIVQRLQGRQAAMVYMAYLSASVLEASPDLRRVTYLATGLTTHVDLEAAKRIGIEVRGVKSYGDRAVAEHAVILSFAALRNVALMDRRVRSGDFAHIQSEEFAGKTLGIVGLGGIGAETARIADALGLRVIAFGRRGVPDGVPALPRSLDEVLAESDIVSLHLPLTEETRNIIDSRRLALMKPGAVLVNTARAALVDETALLEALETGALGHAALDVFHEEPLPRNHRITRMENVTLSAHSAWLTPQAITRLLCAGYRSLRAQIDGKEVR